MRDLRTIQVAQQLTKNLMWLERSNPLMSIGELLEYGCTFSERIRTQYLQVEEFWTMEVGKMKTLEIMLRYLVRAELDAICSAKAAPRALTRGREAPTRERAFTALGRGYARDLSLPMARGRAEELGGGSCFGLHTA